MKNKFMLICVCLLLCSACTNAISDGSADTTVNSTTTTATVSATTSITTTTTTAPTTTYTFIPKTPYPTLALSREWCGTNSRGRYEDFALPEYEELAKRGILPQTFGYLDETAMQMFCKDKFVLIPVLEGEHYFTARFYSDGYTAFHTQWDEGDIAVAIQVAHRKDAEYHYFSSWAGTPTETFTTANGTTVTRYRRSTLLEDGSYFLRDAYYWEEQGYKISITGIPPEDFPETFLKKLSFRKEKCQ